MVDVLQALREAHTNSPVALEDTCVSFSRNYQGNLHYTVYGYPRYANGYFDGEDWVFESNYVSIAMPEKLSFTLTAEQFTQIVSYYYECSDPTEKDRRKYGDLDLLDIRFGLEKVNYGHKVRNVAFACKNTETEEYTLFTYEL
jgi:hypothetical protein